MTISIFIIATIASNLSVTLLNDLVTARHRQHRSFRASRTAGVRSIRAQLLYVNSVIAVLACPTVLVNMFKSVHLAPVQLFNYRWLLANRVDSLRVEGVR